MSRSPQSRVVGPSLDLDAKLHQCRGGCIKIRNFELHMELTLLIGKKPEPIGSELQQRKPRGHMEEHGGTW